MTSLEIDRAVGDLARLDFCAGRRGARQAAARESGRIGGLPVACCTPSTIHERECGSWKRNLTCRDNGGGERRDSGSSCSRGDCRRSTSAQGIVHVAGEGIALRTVVEPAPGSPVSHRGEYLCGRVFKQGAWFDVCAHTRERVPLLVHDALTMVLSCGDVAD
jgi:hypothetical protein